MEQMAHERKPLFEGWNELPVELSDLILFWTTRESPSMAVVIPFVCRESRQRRTSWMLPTPPSTTRRTFETKRDLNIRIAVDAAGCGWLGVLQWLREMGCPFDSEKISFAAVRRGHLEVLKWLQGIGHFIHLGAVVIAARRGRFEIFQWLNPKQTHFWARRVLMWERAARGGHLEILEWARKEDEVSVFKNPKVVAAAARGGHIKLLEWLKDGRASFEMASSGAARGDQMEVLKWLKANGLLGDASSSPLAFQYAAQEGHLEVMKWLKEEAGWKIPHDTMDFAASGGSVEVVAWLREQGCEWTPQAYFNILEHNNLELLRWVREKDSLPTECLHHHMCVGEAARSGHLDILKEAWPHLVHYGKLNDKKALVSCKGQNGGHMNVVKWLSEELELERDICIMAAMGGHLEMLKWARERWCSWDKRVCSVAAGSGDLEMLKWLRANGCRWCPETCHWAAKNGHLDVLRWAIENGCPFNYADCFNVAAHHPSSIQRWLRKH